MCRYHTMTIHICLSNRCRLQRFYMNLPTLPYRYVNVRTALGSHEQPDSSSSHLYMLNRLQLITFNLSQSTQTHTVDHITQTITHSLTASHLRSVRDQTECCLNAPALQLLHAFQVWVTFQMVNKAWWGMLLQEKNEQSSAVMRLKVEQNSGFILFLSIYNKGLVIDSGAVQKQNKNTPPYIMLLQKLHHQNSWTNIDKATALMTMTLVFPCTSTFPVTSWNMPSNADCLKMCCVATTFLTASKIRSNIKKMKAKLLSQMKSFIFWYHWCCCNLCFASIGYIAFFLPEKNWYRDRKCFCMCPYSVFLWQKRHRLHLSTSFKNCVGFCFYDNDIFKTYYY